MDVTTKANTSYLGNSFFAKHPSTLYALDWANPLLREHIHVYPEVSGPISEAWQAGKWVKEVDLDELSPMWADWDNRSL
ncbi:hypothetical protein PLICRDRAFT_180602 [Plicaturopsis crispa FD-325 SS-3]|uniref:Uncharacterized protein n=1 Tax=Plicaturopsis crispa FD-325 SS-3 TaxID=944288 RepID=A0A0C9SVS5_PLICR|nr:hypothetical protein PLICRDRAFT_180602 [Plicaturopsis crispa FD-325 SS-3]